MSTKFNRLYFFVEDSQACNARRRSLKMLTETAFSRLSLQRLQRSNVFNVYTSFNRGELCICWLLPSRCCLFYCLFCCVMKTREREREAERKRVISHAPLIEMGSQASQASLPKHIRFMELLWYIPKTKKQPYKV